MPVPLVSILIPVFDAEQYLEAALESALAQDYEPLEVVCCDDGSTDSSLAILRRYEGRVRVVALGENRGLVEVRNRLLAEARGEFLAWLDADDVIEPDKLRRQLAFLEKNPKCGAVGTGIRYITEDGQLLREESFPDDPELQGVDLYLCCASVLVRGEAAREAGLFRPLFRPGGEDGDWLLRIADHWQLRNIPELLYSYRVRAGSASRRQPAEIRRLGVVTRAAARVRRMSGMCPIDDGRFQAASEQEVLDSPLLTGAEKALAVAVATPDARPLMSIAIPYYNAEQYLGRCLESLRRQDFQNYEILIHDDGSERPLDLVQLLPQFDAEADRIFVSRTAENHGPAYARNRILDRARGRFILFQDADDASEPDRLRLLLAALLDEPGQVAVGSGVLFVTPEGRLLRSEKYPREAISAGGFNGCCGSFLYDRALAGELRFREDLRWASEDIDFLLRAGEKGLVFNIPRLLYSYTVREGSLTSRPEWMAAHADYMWGQFAQRLGVLKEGAFSADRMVDLLLQADTTQTAELLLTRMYRQWVRGEIPLRKFVAVMRIFPRSALHILRQHLQLAFESRLRWLAGLARGAFYLGVRTASALLRRPGREGWRILKTWFRPRLEAKPIEVQVLGCWGDEEEALDLLLPHKRRRWGRVQFSTLGPGWPRRPDYVLVLNQPSKPTRLRMSPNRVWFALGEPPSRVHEPLHLAQGQGTVVLTPARYPAMESGAEPRTFVPTHAMTRSWWVKRSVDELENSGEIPKTRMLSWVTSNISLLRGHRERLAFLGRVRREIPLDLFGRGFQPVGDKWDALAPYRFSIAYENYRAPGYFTEKLMDCLVTLTVPIYSGAPDICDYFPEQAIVRIDPDDPDVLQQIRHAVTASNYERRLAALREARHLVLHRYNMFVHIANTIMNDTRPAGRPTQLKLEPKSLDWSLGE